MTYLQARVEGGVGLITLEVCSAALDHRYQPHSLSLSKDHLIPLHRKITDLAHHHGVKIQPQITHPGPESMASFFEEKRGVGPCLTLPLLRNCWSGFESRRHRFTQSETVPGWDRLAKRLTRVCGSAVRFNEMLSAVSPRAYQSARCNNRDRMNNSRNIAQ
jgi:hypothetical protein